MPKVSIIIPARGETRENLQRTIESIQNNATGDYEIIVGFDGGTDDEYLLATLEDDGIKVINFPDVVGIKTCINAMAAMATGKYLYKSDAHCSFGKGFDEILQADMQDDWIVMPRFYVLNGKTWEWQDDRFYDYFYLHNPFTDPKGTRFKAGGHWPERTAERNPLVEYLEDEFRPEIDETPQIHGSGWMMTKDRFFELGGFPNIDPYGHAQEPIWLGMKNWLAGGKVMVNKKTWYAHLHQDSTDRGYHMDKHQTRVSYDLAAKFFLKDKWFEGKVCNFEDFVDYFMPMPGWDENWKELYSTWKKEN